MIKKTVYTICNGDGTYMELFLEHDTVTIRNYWANDELRGEVEFDPTVAFMADFVAVANALESEVIGE